MELKIITKTEDFEKLREKWNSLLEMSINKSIFLTWEWMYSWWETYFEKNELYILLLYEKEELIGISPTYIKKGIIKTIRFLGDEYVDSCYLWFIINKAYEEVAVKRFMEIILKIHPANLKYISHPEKIAKLSKDFIFKEMKSSICPILNLPSSIEAFLSGLSSKTRFNIKKSERVLIKKNLTVERVKLRENNPEKHIENLFEVNKKRWGDSSCAFDENQKMFLKKVIINLAKNEQAELIFLADSNSKLAYNLNFYFGKTVYVYSSAFDIGTDYGNSSPGLYLVYINVKESISNGHNKFDMLRGENEYKLKLADGINQNYNVFISSKKNIIFIAYVSIIMFLNKLSYIIESGLSKKYRKILSLIVPKNLKRVVR